MASMGESRVRKYILYIYYSRVEDQLCVCVRERITMTAGTRA